MPKNRRFVLDKANKKEYTIYARHKKREVVGATSLRNCVLFG
jgi:hypothetical protein